MIEKYVPLDDDGTSTSRDRVTKDFQVSVISNAFLPYYQSSLFCQSIIFIIFLFRSFTLIRENGFTHFPGERPNVVSRDQLEKNNKRIRDFECQGMSGSAWSNEQAFPFL